MPYSLVLVPLPLAFIPIVLTWDEWRIFDQSIVVSKVVWSAGLRKIPFAAGVWVYIRAVDAALLVGVIAYLRSA